MPHDLTETGRVSQHGYRFVGDVAAHTDALGLRRRRGGDHRLTSGVGQRHRPAVESELTGQDLRYVEQIAGQLRLQSHVAFDGFEPPTRSRRIELAGSQQVQPSEYRVERGAELV